ncbi:hypothetical protein D3C80_1577490 [compost metagenome]
MRGGQTRMAQQRVTLGQHADLIYAQQRLQLGAARGFVKLSEADIVALRAELFLQTRRLQGSDFDADIRIVLAEALAGRRQQRLGEGRQAADGKTPLGELPEAAGEGEDALQPGEGALHLLEQHQRPRRGRQPSTLAAEQLEAHQLFQPRQLAADRGLAGMQVMRGAGHAAGGHHGAEDFDMAEADHGARLAGDGRVEGNA